MWRVSDNNERHKQTTTKRVHLMRNHLVLLIAKYCRLLSAANRLKCGRKVKGSIMGTLNKLRASLARLDKAMRGEVVKFKLDMPLDTIVASYYTAMSRGYLSVIGIINTI